jgi:myo-inositol-1(or 4)-monophosphatase
MSTHQDASPAPASDAGPEADLSQLLSAVREAGALAMRYFGNAPRTEIKPDGTSVSEADYAVDALLKERLAGAGRQYGWLSEESEDDLIRLDQSRIWVVDPIDGTRAYLQNKPEWTISAALVENGHSLLAAVYNPATEEFFHAARGGGAFLNDKPIAVNDPVELEGCRLAAASSSFRPERWARPWPPLETIWVNSIAYRLALVAAGTCDGTVSLSKKSDWDIAAAHLLVHEAGGIVTTHDDSPLVYNLKTPRHTSVMSAGPALHAALIERTSQATL